MDTEKIGAFIAALRKSAGYTQQEVAGRLGLSGKTISKWETGNGLPDITVLPALAELFGVTVDELLAGERLPVRERNDRAERKTEEQTECLLENKCAGVKTRLGIALCGLLLFFILSNTTFSAPVSCGAALIFCVVSAVVCFYALGDLIRTANSKALASTEYGGVMPDILRENGIIHVLSLGLGAVAPPVLLKIVKNRIRQPYRPIIIVPTF